MKTACLSIWLLLIVGTLQAQEPAVQQTLESLMESMGQEPDENADFQEVLDDLTYLGQHPLAINAASQEELQRLHFLSDIQIDDFIEFRIRTGQIYSIYEMASIEGFNADLLQKLEPFISFNVPASAYKNKRSVNDLIGRSTRAFPEGGNENPHYQGSMERYYLRLKHTSGNLEYGVVGEKDPGEAFFAGSNPYGFDYAGGYANFRISQSGSRIFMGDYHLNFGQGLVANQGFSMGKSSETTQVFHSGQGIRSSAATDENQFFRGVAGQFKWRHFSFSPFLSLRTLDAKVDTIDGIPTFGAFQTSGYHRTASEIVNKDALEQIAGGGSAGLSYRRWSLGFTGVVTRFNAVMNRSDEPYNQFLWEGKQNLVGSIDWKGSVKNIFLFGEAAASADKGKALLTGILLKPASNAELTAVYRNINKTYFSFYSNAFTESSRVNDEHSLYLGFKLFPAPHWTLRTYTDLFEYRWIKYTTAAPSNGTEVFAQLTFQPSERTELYLRFFQQANKIKVTAQDIKYNEPQQINRYRFSFSQKINDNFSLRSRIEYSLYSKQTTEQGFLIYQDLICQPLGKRFSMNGRLAWFETDGYSSRLYAYENDLLYSFSVPALYGKGIRAYLNFRQTFNESISLWLKAAVTHRISQKGTEESDVSDTDSELKVQLRYQF